LRFRALPEGPGGGCARCGLGSPAPDRRLRRVAILCDPIPEYRFAGAEISHMMELHLKYMRIIIFCSGFEECVVYFVSKGLLKAEYGSNCLYLGVSCAKGSGFRISSERRNLVEG